MTAEFAVLIWALCLIAGSAYIVTDRTREREVRTIWDLEKEA